MTMGCEQSVPTAVGSSPAFGNIESDSKKQGMETKAFADISQSKTEYPAASSSSVRTARTVASRSTVSLGADEDVSYLLPKVDYNGHLLMEEIVRRTSSSLQCSELSLGKLPKTFKLQYAYRSQRGYNPEEPLSPNKEKHGITLNFASEGGDAMIGVFSGHGEYGHQCAGFSQRVLPEQLAKFVRQKRVQRYAKTLKANGNMNQGAWNPKKWPLLTTREFEQCCTRAFSETNKMLRQEEQIDDLFSGTSAVTVCFHGGRMYLCNIGSCNAILGHRVSSGPAPFDGEEEKCEIDLVTSYLEGGKKVPHSKHERILIPLTAVHTPCCQAELERIKSHGGQVKQCDQPDFMQILDDSKEQEKGHVKKSLRIFLPEDAFPGTRCTRSIGDSGLDNIGVISEPDVISYDLTADEDILILASNGVFEYLTNEEVLNICSAYDDPLQASEAVTKAAYAQWIENGLSYDDITVVVCFISDCSLNSSVPIQKIPTDVHVMVDDYEQE